MRKFTFGKQRLIQYKSMMILALCVAWATLVSAQEYKQITVIPHYAFKNQVTWFGSVENTSAVQVVSLTKGLVVRKNIGDEAYVKQGDILFVLAGKDVEAKALNLHQQYTQAKTEVELAKKNLELKQAQLKQGLATHEQVNASKNVLSLAFSHESSSQLALKSMRAGVQITAPISGIFTARKVNVGQYIDTGMTLATLIDPTSNRITASLFPPQNINILNQDVEIDMPLTVLKDLKVTKIMPAATAQGAIQVWIEGADLNKLSPGQNVSGAVTIKHDAMAIPLSSIAHDDMGNTFVFILDGKKWQKTNVKLGLREAGFVEVVCGLQGDETLADSNVYELLYQDFSLHYQAPD